MAVAPMILPEIVDEIAAFLGSDKAALSSCSLVSHLWCQSSSRHLFHSLQLREPPPGFPKEPLDALYAFLRDNPRVRILVQELKLTSARRLCGARVYIAGISIHRLRSIMNLLPSLHTLIVGVGNLQLCEVSPDSGDPSPDDQYSSISPKRFRLRHISLSPSFCLHIHPTFLSRTLALFDHIGELHFQGSEVYGRLKSPLRFAIPVSDDIELARSAVLPVVKAVTMSHFGEEEKMLSVLSASVGTSVLENLRISKFWSHIVPVVDALLSQATNLRDITLFFPLAYTTAPVDQLSLPGLTACTHLQTIFLGMQMYLDHDLNDYNLVYWRHCLEVLSTTQPTVRRVTIAILTHSLSDTSYFEPLAALDWTLLDRYVTRYPLLECIEVKLSTRGHALGIVCVDEISSRLVDMFSVRNKEFVRIIIGEPDYVDF